MSMSHERRTGLLFAGAVVCVLAFVIVAFVASGTQGLRYTVVFQKGKGLRVGDRVQMNGVDIGEVDSVKLDRSGQSVSVRVKVDKEHRDKVQKDSTAYIASPTLPNVSGQKIVQVFNDRNPSPPMPDGSVIMGKDGLMELKAWQLRGQIEDWSEQIKAAGKELSEAAGKGTQNLKEGAKDYAGSPEVKGLMEKLTAFLATLPEKGRQSMDKVMEEWERLKKEIGPALDRMKEMGRTLVHDKLKHLVDQIEKEIRDLGESMKRAPAEDKSDDKPIHV